MNIQIKKANMGDLKDLQNLNNMLCIKESIEFDHTINRNFPMQKKGREYFIKRIKKGCALIASIDGKVAGYLVGSIFDPEPYRNVKRVAEAENMFVLEEYRSKGIGKKLMSSFIKWCKTKDAKIIRVVISAKNKRSIEFHKREGYGEYEVVLEKKV